MTNLVPLVTPPPADNIAENGQQWIHGLVEVVKILAVLAGSLAGGYFSHRLLLRRDRADRRVAFKAFLKQWQSEIFNAIPPPFGSPYYTGSEMAYQVKVSLFCDHVERARGVFSDTQRFEALTGRLGGLKAQDWDKKQPRDVILKAIDELIAYTEAG